MSTNRMVCPDRRNDSMLFFVILVSTLLGQQAPCRAKVGALQGQARRNTSSGAPDLVSGTVINAAIDQPVRRALVRLNNRAVLTDGEGRFRFEQTEEGSVNILITKPGFYVSPEYGDLGNLYLQSPELAAPLELRIYPEALLTGVVLAPDGTPLPNISVNAMRSVYDDSGRRWMPVDQRQTDSHGRFRIPIPTGEYRVPTQYSSPNSTIRVQTARAQFRLGPVETHKENLM
ncbi:carboxypeptidase-like regulatory domain-containing protein [Tunturiibacter gelidiferens]|uniref:carboxypeptidase-like regulatory domain-containing protein n=1 Tax=Tunturiibacter gelidiferens TaxID=3069689 RepID=UPI003D9AD355